MTNQMTSLFSLLFCINYFNSSRPWIIFPVFASIPSKPKLKFPRVTVENLLYNLLRFYYIFVYIYICMYSGNASVHSVVTMYTSYRLEIKTLTLQVD